MRRYKEFLGLLRENLPEDKVSHCIFVAEYAASLAVKAGVPHDEVVTAGMLHDLCRAQSGDVLLARARGYGLDISESQLQVPMLLHGPVAAEECRDELGIDDEDVYNAIYWHTTGRPGLGRTGQLIYLADFSEPTRKFPEAAKARTLAREQGFEAALRYVARAKFAHLQSKEVVDPIAEDFLHWVEQAYPA
jgi:predicted HD superfamily hydrolase involved in NAD metabolism